MFKFHLSNHPALIVSILSLFIFFLSDKNLNAQVENIVVETYYVSDDDDATDTTGGYLAPGSVTYRVYVDLVKGSKIRSIYGETVHPLIFESTENFFNNKSDGQTFGKEFSKTRLQENTVALDSWITLGQLSKVVSSKAGFGVLKENDSDGSFIGGSNNDGGSAAISSGLLKNNSAIAGKPITESDGIVITNKNLPDSWKDFGFRNVALNIDSTIFGSVVTSKSFYGTNCYLSNSGTCGIDSTLNHVLVAQLTTKGKLSFELNLEVEQNKTNGNGTEIIKYVARNNNIQNGEVFLPMLIYPPKCGCQNPDYLEYRNSFVCNVADSCKTLIRLGCMDPMACNYDQSANKNLSQLCCYIGDCGDRDISLVCPYLSVQEIEEDQHIRIFPNPADQFLNISYKSKPGEKNKVEIIDALGKMIYSENYIIDGSSIENIPLSGMAEGIYSIRITGSQKTVSGRFLKVATTK